ncbi:MAG: hypothetical protein Kow0010_24090 [Dehalococcoidia bacterium]
MHDLVFLMDVDNTLLDTDRVRELLADAMRREVGHPLAERFWEIYEDVRAELDHVSFPETIERLARETDDLPALGQLSDLLYQFPFGECLFPGAIDALSHASKLGLPVILSDGDQLFQRHKIRVSGIERAVGGRVLVQPHKESRVSDIRRLFPARHYVLIDDKPRIHGEMKQRMGAELTTILVCQGRYAAAPSGSTTATDLELAAIGDLVRLDAATMRAAAR